MGYDIEHFVNKLMSQFSGLEAELEWCTDNEKGRILGHCFFPNVLNEPLEKLLKADTDTGRIKKYVAFIEDMYANGDADVKNIVEVSLLEYHALGYEDRLKNLYKYLSPELQIIVKHIKSTMGSPPKIEGLWDLP